MSPLPQKSTAGKAAQENLNAENNMGGNEFKPVSMTTKLNPQINATNMARETSDIFIYSRIPLRP
jgi:hypothetical protein